MNDEIKSILRNCGLNIKNERTTNQIIWALKGRYEKFGKVGISRTEFDKFGISETKLRNIIQELRDLGLITCIGYENILTSKYKACIYQISSVLKGIFSLLSGFFLENLNEKIIEFNKKADIEQIFFNYGIMFFSKKKKLFELKSKITYNKQKNVISNWKIGENYNLFNFLKLNLRLSTKDLFIKLGLWKKYMNEI